MPRTRITPPARPELARAAAVAFAEAAGLARAGALETAPYLVGRRGYYRDSMGAKGVQERGIYDDAIALVTPAGILTFNANTDPSVTRRGVAVLEPGVWTYRIGIHGLSRPAPQRYQALVQGDDVVVRRDGTEAHPAGELHPEYGRCLGGGRWKGRFGINIHRGAYLSTSSLGCQTIYPDQWDEFISAVAREMRAAARSTIPYVLTDRGQA